MVIRWYDGRKNSWFHLGIHPTFDEITPVAAVFVSFLVPGYSLTFGTSTTGSVTFPSASAKRAHPPSSGGVRHGGWFGLVKVVICNL
jgi:hypothetical protein